MKATFVIDRNRLELAKADACFSSGDLQKAAGVSPSTYNRALNHATTAKTVGKLAKALGVDVLDILADPTTANATK